tara:strand:- start:323 stop:616 length:294 start_codon:yes stop_codon:yes gene_type:complete
MDVNAFIAKAKQGAVTVEFTKINTGEVRVMPCTLNPTLLEAAGINVTVEKVDPGCAHIAVWSLDKEAWRSFRVETVTNWYPIDYETKQDPSISGSDS